MESQPDRSKKTADTIYCPRTNRETPVTEHSRCPYCFGDRPRINSGDRQRFCDFHPGEDPIQFGFPDDRGHFAQD